MSRNRQHRLLKNTGRQHLLILRILKTVLMFLEGNLQKGLKILNASFANALVKLKENLQNLSTMLKTRLTVQWSSTNLLLPNTLQELKTRQRALRKPLKTRVSPLKNSLKLMPMPLRKRQAQLNLKSTKELRMLSLMQSDSLMKSRLAF